MPPRLRLVTAVLPAPHVAAPRYLEQPLPDTRTAAEHAGHWKADNSQAPHYSTGHTAWWTCLACPLDDCDWHHDDPHDNPGGVGLRRAGRQVRRAARVMTAAKVAAARARAVG